MSTKQKSLKSEKFTRSLTFLACFWKSRLIWLGHRPVTPKVAGSSPVFFVCTLSECSAVGSAPGLGLGGRMFKSYHSEIFKGAC